MRQLGQAQGTAGALCVDLGGASQRDALITTRDGCLLLVASPGRGSAATATVQIEPLADCHAGAVTGLSLLPGSPSKVLSAGADGSLRVWDAGGGGQIAGRHDFPLARLTALASCRTRALAAAGSARGVLRLVSTADEAALPVVWRARLARGPLTALSFSPGGAMLAVACSDGGGASYSCGCDQGASQVAFVRIGRGDGAAAAELLGYADCGDRVLSMAWLPTQPRSAGGDAGSGSGGAGAAGGELVLSLSNGMLMSMAAPAAAAPVVPSAEAAGGTMLLSRRQLRTRGVAIEAPLSCIEVVWQKQQQQGGARGNSAGASSGGSGDGGGGGACVAVVIGLSSADRRLLKFVLPPDAAAWAGAERPPLRSTAAVVAHDKRGAALALSPCRRFVASAGTDGGARLRDAGTLLEVGSGPPAPRQQQPPQQQRTHASSAGGASALCFDAGGTWLASGGADGSLFLSRVLGESGGLGSLQRAEAEGPLAAEAFQTLAGADAPDDDDEPTLPALLAAGARADEERSGAAAREATARRLGELRALLAALLERNAAVPEGERLSQEEVILDVGRLQELRAEAAAEAEALKSRLSDAVARDEIVAARIKDEFWDSMQVKPAAVTGIASRQEVWNFPLRAGAGGAYARVAALRATELLEAAAVGAPAGDSQELVLRRPHAAAAVGPAVKEGAAGAGAGEAPAAAAAVAVPVAGRGSAYGSDAGDAPSSSGAGDPPLSVRGAAQALQAPQPAAAGPGAASAPPADDLLDCLAAGRAVAPERLLYDDLEVVTPARKAAQAEIYRQMARELQSKFNAAFDALVQRKHADADKISDLNARLDDLERELAKISAAGGSEAAGPAGGGAADTTPAAAAASGGGAHGGGQPAVGGSGRVVVRWADVEDLEESLFSFKPEDIKAPKYQSPEDRARAAAAAASEAEARRRAAADDAFGRALDDMMGGALVRPTDEVADLAAARPAWMNGNPQDFTEDQLREYKEHQAKEKAAIEERVKRRAAMEQERRALRAAAEDAAVKASEGRTAAGAEGGRGAFDDALAALAQRRVAALSELSSLEGRAARLEADAQAAEAAGDAAERRALGRAAAAQEARARVEKELSEARAVLAAQQERASALHAEEKAMDRALKREFQEADAAAAARLAQLYKQRLSAGAGTGGGPGSAADGSAGGTPPALWRDQPPGAAVGAAAAVAAAAGTPRGAALLGGSGQPEVVHLSDTARPESLDPLVWDRFLDFRSRRARLELAARDQASATARAARQAALLESEAAALAAEIGEATSDAAALRAARQAACMDVEMRFGLKAGQVETEPQDVGSLLEGAVMVRRKIVDDLNEVVRSKGRQKMDLLGQIKDFKRGIYALQWENKRADMEADDVASLARELQLLHVTKDFQQLVKAGPGANTNAAGREVANLEALHRTREELHLKRMEEGRRRIRKLEREISAKAQQNAEVHLHLSGLERVLVEQERLQEAAGDHRSEPHDRRMRSVVVARKLKDIIAAQQAEITSLREEVVRLERRTFPHFPESGALQRPAAGADERVPAGRGRKDAM